MKHHSAIGDDPGSPHVKYKVLWEDSPDSLSEHDVRQVCLLQATD